MTTKLTICQIGQDEFGHDERAINRHVVRTYLTSDGRVVDLDLTTDMSPPEFCINGPVPMQHVGLVPRLPVDGAEYFGPNWKWDRAVKKMLEVLDAELIPAHVFINKYGQYRGRSVGVVGVNFIHEGAKALFFLELKGDDWHIDGELPNGQKTKVTEPDSE